MARRHDIDALRVLAFGLLILYHVNMVYVADWGFHVKSPHQWEWLQWPMVFVNRWRMPLIFLVSGLALGLALARPSPERTPLRFGWRRTGRLLVPLIFAMLAVVPIQAYCEALGNGVIEPGFGAFMARYILLQPWPEGGFAGAEHGVTWNHLWYLAYLWSDTMVLMVGLGVVRRLPDSWRARLAAIPERWRGWSLVALPAAYLFACLYWLEPRFPKTHALTDDWFLHAQYFPIFLFGYAMVGSAAFWREIGRLRRRTLALALAAAGVFLAVRAASRYLPPEIWSLLPELDWRAVSRGGHALYEWTALLAILGYAQAFLSRPFGWLPYANQAVYPWYILHQSFIVPLAFYLAPLALPGWAEYGLVLGGTLLGCALLHELLIRRSRWLRPLFGVKEPAGIARAVTHRPLEDGTVRYHPCPDSSFDRRDR